jgi:hypothetical protein
MILIYTQEHVMAINGKLKGKRGEVEFNVLIRNALGHLTLEEARLMGLPHTDVSKLAKSNVHGQCADSLVVSGLAIEIKRQEILQLDKWWRQACVQADRHGLVPVLAYRQNRKEWSVCIPAYFLKVGFDGYITLTEEVFVKWLLEWTK